MSLTISLFTPTDNGGTGEHTALDWGLAGVESNRHNLWSSHAVVAAGGVFLPKLRVGDLYVWPSDLDAFELELSVLLESVGSIAEACGYKPSFVAARLENMLRATQIAQRSQRGVLID